MIELVKTIHFYGKKHRSALTHFFKSFEELHAFLGDYGCAYTLSRSYNGHAVVYDATIYLDKQF